MNQKTTTNTVLADLFKNMAEDMTDRGFYLEISDLLYSNRITPIAIDQLLKKYDIEEVRKNKNEGLELMLEYMQLILADDHLTQKEVENAELLKRIFAIKEGDFYRLKRQQVKEIMELQLKKILVDKVVDLEEAIYIVELQAMFDLSYDQLIKLSSKLVNQAIEDGGNPLGIDFIYLPDNKDDLNN